MDISSCNYFDIMITNDCVDEFLCSWYHVVLWQCVPVMSCPYNF